MAHLFTQGSKLHEWIMSQNCPEQVHTFLYNAEGKTYSFDPKAVMKLSHEAWRPENRDLIKNLCPAGNMLLHFWCSNQFLLKAGNPEIRVNETVRWSYLRGWYAHMKSLQQFLDQEELMKCLPRSSFPFNESTLNDFVDWTYKSIGNSSLGEEPRLLFNSGTGLIHVPSFIYSGRLEHSRRNVNPKNRVCIPLPDPSCWPLTATWQVDSCSLCCDPNKGPYGDPSCWRNGRTFERCCQQDFRHVKCEEIRKSTPGCIDCPQSLSFYCEEAHKFDTVKAWQHMNETYHEYLAELNISRDLRLEIASNQSQLEDLEKQFYSLLPHVVSQQSRINLVTQSDEYRLHATRVDFFNDTLNWLLDDVRPPVAKNHSVVAKELRALTDKHRAANNTYTDNVKREINERQRKIWLTDRLFNNTRDLGSLNAEIDSINLTAIWQTGNETFRALVQLNESLDALNSQRSELLHDLQLLDAQMLDRLAALGFNSSRLDSELNSTRAELSRAEKKLSTAQQKLSDMSSKKADCARIDEISTKTKANDAVIRTLHADISGNVSRIDILSQELHSAIEADRGFVEREINALAQSDWIEIHISCFEERLRSIQSVLSNLTERIRDINFRLDLSVTRRDRYVAQTRTFRLQLTLVEGTAVPLQRTRLLRDINKLKTDISTQNESLHRRNLEVSHSRRRRIERTALEILESFLISALLKKQPVGLYHVWYYQINSLFSGVFPSWLYSDRFSLVQSLFEKLASVRYQLQQYSAEPGVAWSASAQIIESVTSIKRMKILQLKTLKDELADAYRKQEEANRLLQSNFELETNAKALDMRIDREEAMLSSLRDNLRDSASMQLEALLELRFVDQALTRLGVVHRDVILIAQDRAARGVSIEQLKHDMQSSEATVLSMNATRARLEVEQAQMKESLPALRRNCRSFREKDYMRLSEEARIETDVSRNLSAQVEYQQRQITELNRNISTLTETDPILQETHEGRTKLLQKLEDHIQPRILALEQARYNLTTSLGRIVDDANSRMLRLNSAVDRRNRTISETPAFEAELAIKDEQIHNTSIKQEEGMVIMIALAPNITDKEANLSIWTQRLSDIENEIKIINASLQSSLVDMQAFGNTKNDPSWFAEFANVSSRLNETFYNLTHAQESLRNSTNRTANLVDEYKRSEKIYLEREAELQEYARQVDAGIIPKVNFTFVY